MLTTAPSIEGAVLCRADAHLGIEFGTTRCTEASSDLGSEAVASLGDGDHCGPCNDMPLGGLELAVRNHTPSLDSHVLAHALAPVGLIAFAAAPAHASAIHTPALSSSPTTTPLRR